MAWQFLRCNGVGRDKDHDRALVFYFNRPVTDDEMRMFHGLMREAAICVLPIDAPQAAAETRLQRELE